MFHKNRPGDVDFSRAAPSASPIIYAATGRWAQEARPARTAGTPPYRARNFRTIATYLQEDRAGVSAVYAFSTKTGKPPGRSIRHHGPLQKVSAGAQSPLWSRDRRKDVLFRRSCPPCRSSWRGLCTQTEEISRAVRGGSGKHLHQLRRAQRDTRAAQKRSQKTVPWRADPRAPDELQLRRYLFSGRCLIDLHPPQRESADFNFLPVAVGLREFYFTATCCAGF